MQQCKALPLLELNDKGHMEAATAAAGGGEEKEADDGRMEDVETELAIGIGTRWPPRSIMDRMTSKHQDS